MELRNCKLVLKENIEFFFPNHKQAKIILSNLLTLVEHLMLHGILQYLLGEKALGGGGGRAI
jgi:hypothetical protein